MHHGGRLIRKYYLDGTAMYFDYADKDKMSLTEIDCMTVYLGHIGRIDYWYKVQDEGNLKRVEFDSEVIEMCENVPKVRLINMYMDHRDNLDDVLNSQFESNMYCRYSSQVYDYADNTKKANSKGKEKVAEVDEGCVDAEINKVRRSVKKMNPSIQQEADEDSS
ncbi:hypothetical protein ACE6H2_022892 [Prunus campanulata]